jgi:hypothetical protein
LALFGINQITQLVPIGLEAMTARRIGLAASAEGLL